MNKENCLVLIVNYNQEPELPGFLQDLKKYTVNYHVLVVDDGSTDRSREVIKEHGFSIIEHPRNFGIGAAIRSGILYARENDFEYIAIMSSNGKMYPSQLERILTPVLTGQFDYSTGSRFLKGGNSPGLSMFRRISIPIFSLFSSFLLGKRFSDVTCGFRCYKIKFLDDPEIDIMQPWLERYQMEYYIHFYAVKKKLRFIEIPVNIPYSHLGRGRKSKIRPFIDWWKMASPFILLKVRIRK